MSGPDRLKQNARITVEAACGVRPGNSVVILAETFNKAPYNDDIRPCVRALAQACLEIGAHPAIVDIEQFVHSPAFDEGLVLEPVLAAMASADVVINAVDYVNFTRLTGESGNVDGAWKGDKYIQATQRWFALQSHGMDEWDITVEDVASIGPRTDRVQALAGSAESVHITSPAGTDFTAGVGAGALVTSFRVLVPLYGEVPIVPRQGSENGVLIVDGPSQKGVRPTPELGREPLRIVIDDGLVRDYGGDAEQVERLRHFIEDADPRADHVDEVGIVTTTIRENDRYWWEDGTHCSERTHVALGNNVQRDGRVHGHSHMDLEVNRPTIAIDGLTIVRDGVFLDDNLPDA